MNAPTPREEAQAARERHYRAEILKAAERLVAERGVDGMMMRDVSRESRIALGTIYRLYESKQEIYDSLVSERANEMLAQASGAVMHLSPVDDLIEFVLEITRYYLTHPTTLRAILRTTPMSWGLIDGNDSWSAYSEFHRRLAERATPAEQLDARDPRLVCRVMVSIMQVHLGTWIEDGCSRSESEVVHEIRADLMRLVAPATARNRR